MATVPGYDAGCGHTLVAGHAEMAPDSSKPLFFVGSSKNKALLHYLLVFVNCPEHLPKKSIAKTMFQPLNIDTQMGRECFP